MKANCQAVFLAAFLCLGQVLSAQDQPLNGDVNGDGKRNIADAVYLLSYLFVGGPEPAEACAPCDSCCPEISRPLKTGCDLILDLQTGWATPEAVAPDFAFWSEGQDGFDQAGASRHYELVTFGSEDPKDWVTVDYATGLMWQTQHPEERFEDVNSAIEYCDNLTLGPFDDWRLPNVNELLTLVKFSHREDFRCGRVIYTTESIMDMEFFRWPSWPRHFQSQLYWT